MAEIDHTLDVLNRRNEERHRLATYLSGSIDGADCEAELEVTTERDYQHREE